MVIYRGARVVIWRIWCSSIMTIGWLEPHAGPAQHSVTMHHSKSQRKTAMRSCRSRKRAVYFYSPGGVRRSHDAALHVRSAAAAAAAAATRQLTD